MSDTSFRNFHGNLINLKQQSDLKTALDACALKAGNSLSLTTLCYTMSGGFIYYEGNMNGSKVTNDISNGIMQLNTYTTLANSNRQYMYGNIYNGLLTRNTGGYMLYNDLKDDILDLNAGIDMIKPGGIKDFSMNELLTIHGGIKSKRNDLDMKMRDLYENEYSDNQLLHDNSVYFTLAWTVLATSVLYYLFVKL